ncbi:MAG: enoyl-CoA hydratase/isomerase family protein [Deltaproteobacteria bacterium]|nr:enoyl-CoA hydratase/isomerase family protein [Deltaproteobacteria bacterium]
MNRYKQILYVKRGPILRVTMNRPRYHNAQSRILLEELDQAFQEGAADPEVRVIILAAEGEHFSSGHDLGTPEQKADDEQRPFAHGLPGKYQRQWELYHDRGIRWRDLPKPTIAEVHGYCIFGGWLIASAMDLIVASEDALFLPSFLQYFSMPWDVGAKKTKEILFQMRFVKAKEACDLGFVNIVASREKLEAETMALAERIAESDPLFTRLVKLSINQVQDVAGFRVAAQSAFSNYMLIHEAGLVRSQQDIDSGKRTLSRVDQAFRHLKESE